MKHGLPVVDHLGGYWWFRSESKIAPEPQALFVRWVRGAVQAVYCGRLTKVTEMQGEWCGPIPLPDGWK